MSLFVESLDARLVRLAWRVLRATCEALGVEDCAGVARRRGGDANLVVRRVWLHVCSRLSRAEDDRSDWVAAERSDRRAAEPRPILSQVALSHISGLDRGCVRTDIAAVAEWRAKNPMVDRLCFALEDALADALSLIETEQAHMEELLFELAEDRKARRLARKRRVSAEIVAAGPGGLRVIAGGVGR